MIAKIIILGLPLIGLGMNIALHGKKRKKKYNGWTSLIALIIAYTLYYYAGIFNLANL